MPSSDVRSSETSAQNAQGKSSHVQIFTVSYFAVLIFAFWSLLAKIAKIWTSRKFPAIRYNACEMVFAETTAKYKESLVVLYPDPTREERV